VAWSKHREVTAVQRREFGSPSRSSTASTAASTNPDVGIGTPRHRSGGRVELEPGGILVLLLTLLITLLDRYRPEQIARFGHDLSAARPDLPIPG
jgi:hypothetical protein